MSNTTQLHSPYPPYTASTAAPALPVLPSSSSPPTSIPPYTAHPYLGSNDSSLPRITNNTDLLAQAAVTALHNDFSPSGASGSASSAPLAPPTSLPPHSLPPHSHSLTHGPATAPPPPPQPQPHLPPASISLPSTPISLGPHSPFNPTTSTPPFANNFPIVTHLLSTYANNGFPSPGEQHSPPLHSPSRPRRPQNSVPLSATGRTWDPAEPDRTAAEKFVEQNAVYCKSCRRYRQFRKDQANIGSRFKSRRFRCCSCMSNYLRVGDIMGSLKSGDHRSKESLNGKEAEVDEGDDRRKKVKANGEDQETQESSNGGPADGTLSPPIPIGDSRIPSTPRSREPPSEPMTPTSMASTTANVIRDLVNANNQALAHIKALEKSYTEVCQENRALKDRIAVLEGAGTPPAPENASAGDGSRKRAREQGSGVNGTVNGKFYS